jgi:hypothetical protein
VTVPWHGPKAGVDDLSMNIVYDCRRILFL